MGAPPQGGNQGKPNAQTPTQEAKPLPKETPKKD
jgi:hypothetical protein